MVMSWVVLVIFCSVLADGASILKKTKGTLPMINFNNSSNAHVRISITNCKNNTANAVQYRKIQEDLENIHTSLKKMQHLMELLYRTRMDIDATTSGLENTDIGSKKLNASKSVGRKLAIVYYPAHFKLKDREMVQGKYNNLRYIHINDSLSSSAPTFKEMRKALDPYFINARRIDRIKQHLGYSKTGKIVVQVTSPDGNITSDSVKWEFCEGRNHYNKNELSATWSVYFRINDHTRLMMSDFDRRTVVWIHSYSLMDIA